MFRFIEKSFAVAMLFYTTGALLHIFIPKLSWHSGLPPTAAALAIQSFFYFVAFSFIALRWRTVFQGAWTAKWILALLAVILASTLWSQDPALTLRRGIVLCATTAFAIYFATRFDIQDQLRLLACSCGLVVCASFLCAMFLPEYGIDQDLHFGVWQGAFYQKNMLARAMVLTSLVFLFVRFRSMPALRWIGLAGSLALLVLSRSVTGVLVLAAILASWPLYKIFRARFAFAIPVAALILTITAGVAAYTYTVLPTLLDILNRNEGLSGRVRLWDAVWLSISKQPWLGYGFDAFWQGLHGESGNIVLSVGWTPEYAHNGFLDVLLSVGFLGLAVFACSYLALWRRAFHFLSRTPGPAASWVCVYLAFMLLYNITEGPVVSQNNISWVLYVATAVSLGVHLHAGCNDEEAEENS